MLKRRVPREKVNPIGCVYMKCLVLISFSFVKEIAVMHYNVCIRGVVTAKRSILYKSADV